MSAAAAAAAPTQRAVVVFGTSQDRRLFPLYFAPDRLGNEMFRRVAPDLGPGSYDSHKLGTMLYDLTKTPRSKRGYYARTAARFPPCSKTVTPSPQQYQQDHSQTRIPPPSKTPFNSTSRRFRTTSSGAEDNPGPGTYTRHTVTNRKVSWQMCFGRPLLPPLEEQKPALMSNGETELRKHRRRLAYLSLYY
ncbi:ciliary microtubule-associated protein 3 [Nelusetta ayraudi]|uniref:ciliary microtubule-associated protein 3 n=1 Tax=Nelusetta ayraudi TaxID=303726 RepID=UPI003F72DFE4